VAAVYHTRPPYPEETFEILIDLLPERNRSSILDLGCGIGDLTIPLAKMVDQIDAIDFSAAMLSQAKARPGGDNTTIHWHCIAAEQFECEYSYSLICAGQSLHWMDWEGLFPKIKQMLHNDGFIVLAKREVLGHPWTSRLKKLIPHYSTNQDFQPYDLVDELVARGLFVEHGRITTCAVPFEQSLEDYVESFHSSNGFSRDRMDEKSAAAFDKLVEDIVSKYSQDNIVTGEVRATVVWGKS
jgi:SAM-dependent methyltransferase